MKISLSTKQIPQVACDLAIIFVGENWQKEVSFLGKEITSLLLEVARNENFIGKENQSLSLNLYNFPTKKLLFYAIDEDIKNIHNLQETLAKTIKTAEKNSRKKIALLPYFKWSQKLPSEVLAHAISKTFFLSTYRFNKYQSKTPLPKPKIEELIVLTTPAKLSAFETGINLGKIYAEGTNFARNLVNEPASITTPSHLAKTALSLAENKLVKVTVLEKEEMAKLGMNCVLGVAQGSDHPPKFIRLAYKPPSVRTKIVLIGKGITFDTGGLSLKPSASMETMKIDMAAAAAILGVFSKLAQLKPKIEVIGLITACENMPSGKALHPGDILQALNGKTIEVLNTDAEGRLTLADVLSYAVLKEKPAYIIDLATLTGACMKALGRDIAGLFTNNPSFAQKVKQAADNQGELLWELPLAKQYQEEIKSSIADLRNIGKTSYAGAITAALFLEEFVGGIPWVHLDIAGPAYKEKETALNPAGATGFGVCLLLHLLNLLENK